MIFDRDFNNLTSEDIELLNSYFDGYDYQSSGHTFIANYIWRNTHNITWQIIGTYLFIAGMGTTETQEEEYFMSFPLTKDGQYNLGELRKTICTAKEIFEEKGIKFEMSLIPGTLAPLLKEAFGDEVELTHTRDDDDYIYLREDLVKLGGRKLHHKKNHLNYFKRNYQYIYEEISPENCHEVKEFIRLFNKEKYDETPEEWQTILELETQATEELLKFVGKGLLGGVIRIDGKVEAVTLGEFAKTNSKETVIVHVEKASSKYRGIYQAINNEFCRALPEDTIFINREEDMGMETLRQTKLSYRPVKLAEKYTAVFTEQ